MGESPVFSMSPPLILRVLCLGYSRSCLTSAPWKSVSSDSKHTALCSDPCHLSASRLDSPFPSPWKSLVQHGCLEGGGVRPRITAEVNCLGGKGPKRGHVSLRSRPGSPLKVMMGTAASMSSSYEATWKMTSQLTRVQLGFQHGSGHLRWPWGTVLFLNATFTDKHC